MTEIGQTWLRWRLNEDGGGTVWIAVEKGPGVDDRELVFDSLDQIPENIANAIRTDVGCDPLGLESIERVMRVMRAIDVRAGCTVDQ